MTTHITFPDIDYTAIVTEANSFLASQSIDDASTELTLYRYLPETLDSLEEIIPSLFTAFVSKNLSIVAATIVVKPAAYSTTHFLDCYVLHIPLTSGIDQNIKFFDVAEDAELVAEWQQGVMLSYYDPADCTETDVVELQPGTGILLNTNCAVQWGTNTAPTAYINIGFNRDLSNYFD